jgi:hypothetical protein
MMTLPKLHLLILTSLILLNSCATKLSGDQKKQISSVYTPPVVNAVDSYSTPNFVSDGEIATMDAMSNAGMFGFVGALTSGLVIAADSAHDAKINANLTKMINENARKNVNPATRFNRALNELLKKDPYYGKHLSGNQAAPAKVQFLNLKYFLSSVNDVQFRPIISAQMQFVLNNKVTLKRYISSGMSIQGKKPMVLSDTLMNYAANPNLVINHFDLCAQNMAEAAAAILSAYAGNPPPAQ